MLIANLATILANKGKRVGIVDTNFQSPILHLMFGIREDDIAYWLNDYLWGQCKIEQTIYPVTLNTGKHVYIIPAYPGIDDIAKILRKGYADNLLANGFEDLIDKLKLDLLLVDLYSGLQEETLLMINISDVLLIVLRPNQQDYQESSVIVEVTRHFDVAPEVMLVLNELPPEIDFSVVKSELMQAYNSREVFALPHSQKMAMLSSHEMFVSRYPADPMTTMLTAIATRLVAMNDN
jgi:MinD-like ATPase involved in chromosome partitioning or flagellar assembly